MLMPLPTALHRLVEEYETLLAEETLAGVTAPGRGCGTSRTRSACPREPARSPTRSRGRTPTWRRRPPHRSTSAAP